MPEAPSSGLSTTERTASPEFPEIGAKPLLLSHQCYPVVPQFESKDSFGIAVRAIAFEPSGSSKGTVASEIREGRQITTLNLRSLLHPRRIVLNVLHNLRPAA